MDTVKALDLVFFRGREIVSKSIRVVESIVAEKKMTIYSHIGVVIDKSILPIDEIGEGLYILESTLGVKYPHGGNVPKDIRGKGRFGVQLRPLMDVIREYVGDVAIGPLLVHVDTDIAREATIEIWKKYKNGRYAGDPITLLASAFPFLHKPSIVTRHIYTDAGKIIHMGEADQPYIMCSQLVSILYKKLGLIPKNIDPEDVMPMDLLDIRNMFPVIIGDLINII